MITLYCINPYCNNGTVLYTNPCTLHSSLNEWVVAEPNKTSRSFCLYNILTHTHINPLIYLQNISHSSIPAQLTYLQGDLVNDIYL